MQTADPTRRQRRVRETSGTEMTRARGSVSAASRYERIRTPPSSGMGEGRTLRLVVPQSVRKRDSSYLKEGSVSH